MQHSRNSGRQGQASERAGGPVEKESPKKVKFRGTSSIPVFLLAALLVLAPLQTMIGLSLLSTLSSPGHGETAFLTLHPATDSANADVQEGYVAAFSGNLYRPIDLNAGEAVTNLWNVRNNTTFNGYLEMGVSQQGWLETNISLQGIPYALSYAPAGLPEIGYGDNFYGVPYHGLSPNLTLPLNISNFTSRGVTALVNYTLGSPQPQNLPVDLTFDMLIKNNVTGPVTSSSVEVMIQLYNSGMIPVGISPTFNTTEPLISNGTIQSVQWEVYDGTGPTGAHTVSFVLQKKYQQNSANVALVPQDFIGAAESILHLKLNSSFLVGIEMGTEFGNGNMSRANWSWVLHDYALYMQNGSQVHIIPGSFSNPQKISPVTFVLTGSVPSAGWGLNIRPHVNVRTGHGGAIVYMPNGTYTYSISTPPGISVTPSSGEIVVIGRPAVVVLQASSHFPIREVLMVSSAAAAVAGSVLIAFSILRIRRRSLK